MAVGGDGRHRAPAGPAPRLGGRSHRRHAGLSARAARLGGFGSAGGAWRGALRHIGGARPERAVDRAGGRSEEHTSELQSLMRISYAVFCLKKKKKIDLDIKNSYIEKRHY